MAGVVESLRAEIRALEGGPVGERKRVLAGVDELDGLIAGLPCPGIVELVGDRGSGCTRLVLSVVARATERGERVAWLDLTRTFYPPAALRHGVDLQRVVVVRPPAHAATWAAEQVIRAGCLPLVVIHEPEAAGRADRRWALAAEMGHCRVLVIRRAAKTRSGNRSQRVLASDVRLEVRGQQVTVQRNRGGLVGAKGPLPVWPSRVDPGLQPLRQVNGPQ